MSRAERQQQISSIRETLSHPEALGQKTEVMSRVTGYYRMESAANKGKVSEYSDRQAYAI